MIRFRYTLILVFLAYLSIFPAISQETTTKISPKFDGFYLGVNAGVQNVFGGSFVNEMDILAQEHRFVLEFQSGFRKQFFSERWLIGVELQLGLLNADLMHMEQNLSIHYDSNFQSGIGLTTGYVLGRQKNILVFIYANETTRKFEVNIQTQNFDFMQTDKQGMLKYGLGMEYALKDRITIRGTTGWLNVDFGNLVTNIDVEDKMDFTLGAIFQF